MMTVHLPILNEQGTMSETAPLITLAIMYFADDVHRVNGFLEATSADALMQSITEEADVHHDVIKAGLFDRQSFWRFLQKGKEADALEEDAIKAVRRGQTAAMVLMMALRLGCHVPRFASVNNAVRLICRAWDRGDRAVLSDWGRMKCVSHLWAAHAIFTDFADDERGRFVSELSGSLQTEIPGLPFDEALRRVDSTLESEEYCDLFDFFRDENFLLFLSMAEAFRIKGERQKASGAREYLLAPGTAFAVPSALAISPAALDFAPLEAWMVEELGSI